jgi:hypothetical protein
MPIREIPRAEWRSFFDSFNRAHTGWLCTLEVDAPAMATEIAARWLPFAGVDLDRDASGLRVELLVGDQPDAHMSHTLERPTGVWIEENLEGAESGLRIESEAGTARLWFRSPLPLEQVDGLV